MSLNPADHHVVLGSLVSSADGAGQQGSLAAVLHSWHLRLLPDSGGVLPDHDFGPVCAEGCLQGCKGLQVKCVGAGLQGVVQETLATKKFGPEQARFTQLKALNGFQSIACFAWALLLIFITHSRWDEQPPITAYSKAAISNSIGPACGFEALKNISYPAQVHGMLQPCTLGQPLWGSMAPVIGSPI